MRKLLICENLKVILRILITLIIFLMAFCAGAYFYLQSHGRTLITKYASESLGRPLNIDSLHLKFYPMRLEISGLHLANQSWGSVPDMIRIDHVDAQIDPSALMHGVLRYRYLTVDGLAVTLERNANGLGNWKFSDQSNQKKKNGPNGGLALIPKNRSQFPSLLNATLHNGAVRIRTSSGNWLQLNLQNVRISAANDDTPAQFFIDGTYNNVPTTLNLESHSFNELRDFTKPFGMDLKIATHHDQLHFVGTMMEPLDVEGINGIFQIKGQSLDELASLGGAPDHLPFEIDINSVLKKENDHWQFDSVKGNIIKNDFTGKILFVEGPRKKSDKTSLNLHFQKVAADVFLRTIRKTRQSKPSISLIIRPSSNPSTTLDTQLSFDQLDYNHAQLTNAAIHAILLPDLFDIQTVKGNFAGGNFSSNITIRAENNITKLHGAFIANNLSICGMLNAFRATCSLVDGNLSLKTEIAAMGDDLTTVMKHNNGTTVISIKNGEIKRAALEKISEDMRTLVRRAKGSVPISCFHSNVMLKNGIAIINPLILQTPIGSIYGGGKLDLINHRQAIVIGSDPNSTSIWALDLPIDISGPLDKPDIGLAGKSDLAPYLGAGGNGC